MNATITNWLLEAVDRAVADHMAASNTLENHPQFRDNNAVGHALREAAEQKRQDVDLITGWLARERKPEEDAL